MESFQLPPSKKPRALDPPLIPTPQNAPAPAFDYASAPTFPDEKDLSQPPLVPGSKSKPCTKFFSTSGCPYGESCHFLHFVPGGIAALGMATMIPTPIRQTHGPMQAGNDPSITVNGYKTRLCNRFNTPEGCRFGDHCHFAHGENDLRPKSYTLAAPAQASTTANAFSGQAVTDASGYTTTYNATGSYAAAAPVPAPAVPYTDSSCYATSYNSNGYVAYPTPYPTYQTSTPYPNYPSSYYSDPACTQTVSNVTYYGEPTPPGVTVVPPMAVPTGYEAALTA